MTVADRNARVVAALPLVGHTVRRMKFARCVPVEYDDLYSEGVKGLIAAAGRYDESRGLAFSTFAVPRIRGAMLDYLRSLDAATRAERRTLTALEAAEDRLTPSLQRTPTRTEIHTESALPDKQRRRAERALLATDRTSLDAPLPVWRSDRERQTLHDVTASTVRDPQTEYARTEARASDLRREAHTQLRTMLTGTAVDPAA